MQIEPYASKRLGRDEDRIHGVGTEECGNICAFLREAQWKYRFFKRREGTGHPPRLETRTSGQERLEPALGFEPRTC